MQAWILPALTTEKPQRFYAFAALYALPAATLLGQPGWASCALFGLCALHLQVCTCTVPAHFPGLSDHLPS